MTGKLRPIRIEGQVAYVPLSQGYEAVIDAADAAHIGRYFWSASVGTHAVYATRAVYSPARGRTTAKIPMHVEILGRRAGLEVDHIDGDGLNNQRCNLRHATRTQNKTNTGKYRNNKSGFKGVYWDPRANKWRAQIRANGKKYCLGLFTEAEDAHAAYCAASDAHHGAFGRHT